MTETNQPRGVYWVAEEIAEIARDIIFEHHRHLVEQEANVLYLFTTKKRQKAGKVILGTAQKANDLLAFLSSNLDGAGIGADFVLIFDWNRWQWLEPESRRALVDHELCHCGWDEGPVILPHDLEEFTAIVQRHGYWQSDVEAMARAMQPYQHTLPLFSDEAAAAADSLKSMVGKGGVTGITLSSSNGQSVTIGESDEEAEEPSEQLLARARKIVKVEPIISTMVLQRALGCKYKTAALVKERLKEEGTIGAAMEEKYGK